jgi:PAS domain-containing protein
MYRLVIVAGPNRGSAFTLIEGENSIGRQIDNHIVLSSSKVSKRHCSILVADSEVFFRDEGSTNGTFVNGALTRKQTLKPGDKLGVGDFVMELVGAIATSSPRNLQYGNHYSHTSGSNALAMMPGITMPPGSVSLHPQMQAQPMSSVAPVVQAPKDVGGHLQFIFEGKIMPFFYGILLKTELRVIAGMLFAAVVGLAVVGSMMPMIDLAEKSIQRESITRAKILAREVADRFVPMIANHTETQIDLSLLEGEETVKLAVITNTDLQIIAPQSRLNQLLAGGREAAFAMMMAKDFKDGREKGGGGLLDESTAIYVEPIKLTDPRQVKATINAMAVVAVDFSGNLLQTGGVGVAYGTGFVIGGLAGLLAYFILLRLFFKPLEVLNDDLDQVLRGELPKVTKEFQIKELDGLFTNLNAAVQRIPRGNSDFGQGSEEVGVNWDHEFAGLRALAEVSQQGFVGFDTEQKIVAMNPQFEEVSGIRGEALGQTLNQAARDQAFVSLVNDLRDRVQSSPSRSALDEFEFSGVAYQVIGVGAGTIHHFGFGIIFKRKE